jgi:FMN phosphatase YigB (HAD superfamily)
VNVSAERAVMVGDSVRQDVDGAIAAGMQAVLVNRGPSPHPLENELAVRGIPIVRSLLELRGRL